MKKILLLLLISTFSFAQNANRKFEKIQNREEVLQIKVSDGLYNIKFINEKIIETTFLPNGELFNTISHAIILDTNLKNLNFVENEKFVDCYPKSGKLKVRIEKSPFKIAYFNNEIEILSEKAGYIKKDSTEILNFNIDATEKLYGGGERVLGMNRRGNRLQLYNRAHYGYGEHAELMNFCIPLVYSSKMYAVHFDNPAIGYLDLDSKKDNTLEYETISGRKTYQVIVGDTWADLIKNYTDLTGKQPLPPRWALGNFSSRFGYHSQEQVTKTIERFNKDEIPVDAIILDLYWFGKTVQGTMGNLEWDKDTFPNPTKMIADLNEKGIKTILITEPFILTTSGKWQEAVDKKVLATDKLGNPFKYDFYFGNTGIVDIFKPEAKDWFWSIYKKLINQGIGGIWGDLGEPEVLPTKAITAGGKADEIHNIYGHNWAKLISEGYKNNFPEQRPFILMRSGYSGSQRFGMIPWSGDVSRSWSGLQSQTEIALQMGMQGMGYMHSDLGGFAGDYFDNELYIRWLQYGVFQPIFRPHAQEDVASEPVYKDIVTKAKAKKQIELRYQMLPYNYTLAFENNQKGIPLMRPLFFEEPTNSKLSTVCETYLWGNDFLVTPITKAAQKTIPIYFPKNNNWFDFYSDKKYLAGKTKNIKVEEDHIPVFVRGGSFIPLIKTIQNTSKYSLLNFDLHYYFDEKTIKSEGKLFNDNGKTPNSFEKGEFEILNFTSDVSSNKVTLKLSNTMGTNYQPTDKNITLVLHNLNLKAKKIVVNGEKCTFKRNKNTIEILVQYKKSEGKIIQIQF